VISKFYCCWRRRHPNSVGLSRELYGDNNMTKEQLIEMLCVKRDSATERGNLMEALALNERIHDLKYGSSIETMMRQFKSALDNEEHR
jgi:hypothetical protein